MTVRSKYFLQKGSSQETNRLALAAHWTLASSLRARSGLLPNVTLGAGLVTAQGTPSTKVDVAAFQSIIQGGQALQGVYDVTNDGPVTGLEVLGGGAGGLAPDSLPRRDIICVRVQDSGYGDATTANDLVVVRGAPNAAPSDPSLSQANAGGSVLPLYRVNVKALAAYGGTVVVQNADLVDLRRWTVPRGGVVPVVDQADRDTLALWPGLTVWRLDSGVQETYDGTGWDTYAPTNDTGWVTGAGLFTFAAGWTISGSLYRRSGPVVSVQINMTRTGAAIAAGNIANIDMVNIANALKPLQSNGALGGGPSGADFAAYASTGGTIIMTAANQAIGVGDGVNVFGTYLL